MTYNTDDLKRLKEIWQAAEAQAVELQSPVPDGPQFPLGAVPIPISSTARQKAAGMANLCRNADLKEIMRRNLLAMIAVHNYLRLQGYLPDLRASDCWNPILGRTGEVADLVVSQVGRFECCAIKPGQSSCPVPSEGQFGRSGYVAVEMDAEERWGWLLGFLPTGEESNPIKTLNRNELQSMDEFGYLLHRLWLLWNIVQEGSEPWDVALRAEMVALLERIYRTRSAAQRPIQAAAEMTQLWGEEVVGAEPRELAGAGRKGGSSAEHELRHYLREVFDRLESALVEELPFSQLRSLKVSPEYLNQNRVWTNLRQWFDEIFEGGWQTIESLLVGDHLALAARSRDISFWFQIDQSVLMARAWKVFDLEQLDHKIPIVLVLVITPQSQSEGVEIRLQAYPGGSSIRLPADLQLSIQDQSDTKICSAQSENEDNWLQLGFVGQPREVFSIKVTLGDFSITESFSI
jgi:Protein of unknown function (DUF1822)